MAQTRKSRQGVGFNNPAFQPLPKTRKLQINGFVKPSGTRVASAVNDRNEIYFVQIFASGKITCKHENGHDCFGLKFSGHCYHVDAVTSADLPSYSQLVAYSIAEVVTIQNELLCSFEREAPVTIENFYEIEGPRKQVTYPSAYGSCLHLVKPEHEGQLCGACRYK